MRATCFGTKSILLIKRMIRLLGSFSKILCSISLLRQPWDQNKKPFPYHGIASIQNNDNHVALVYDFFQLAEKRSARLLGRTILFESLRLLFYEANDTQTSKLWSSNLRFFSNCSAFICAW